MVESKVGCDERQANGMASLFFSSPLLLGIPTAVAACGLQVVSVFGGDAEREAEARTDDGQTSTHSTRLLTEEEDR